MGLFGGSKSVSSTTTNYDDYSANTENQNAIGDLSSNNTLTNITKSSTQNVKGNYYEQGITGDNLNSLLGTVETLNTTTQTTLTNNFGDMIGTVQKTAETAINAANLAYAESDSELRNVLDSLKPFMLYGSIAAIFYFVFKR